jgi:hypothetical protein
MQKIGLTSSSFSQSFSSDFKNQLEQVTFLYKFDEEGK